MGSAELPEGTKGRRPCHSRQDTQAQHQQLMLEDQAVGQVVSAGCEAFGDEGEPEGPLSSQAAGVDGGEMPQGRWGDMLRRTHSLYQGTAETLCVSILFFPGHLAFLYLKDIFPPLLQHLKVFLVSFGELILRKKTRLIHLTQDLVTTSYNVHLLPARQLQ